MSDEQISEHFNEPIFDLFADKLENYIKEYSEVYTAEEWGADKIALIFNSFIDAQERAADKEDTADEENTTDKEDTADKEKAADKENKSYLSLSEDGSLKVRSNSLNLFLNFYHLQYIKEFQYEYEKISNEYSLRNVLIMYCHALKAFINSTSAQFTYLGERFVLSPERWQNVAANDRMLNAAPVQKAGTLCSIDSLRLYEKVKHCIDLVEQKTQAARKEYIDKIKIAVFGRLSDTPGEGENELYNIEDMAQNGYIYSEKDDGTRKTYDVEINSFKLIKADYAMLQFKEEIRHPDSDSSEPLVGNLYEPDFLKAVQSKYDMVCLLDMGCFYDDVTNLDTSYDTITETIKNRTDVIRHNADPYDVFVHPGSYLTLYNAYIEWNEYVFYRKIHHFEFDPKIFAALNWLIEPRSFKTGKHSCPVYSYISHDRGHILDDVKRFQNLCKGEFYNGRSVLVYDWNGLKEASPDNIEKAIKERDMELLGKDKAGYTKKSILPVRMWKIIKSLGEDFYSHLFTEKKFQKFNLQKEDPQDSNTKKENSGEDFKPDFDFIHYLAENTYLILDYSKIKEEKTIYFAVRHYGDTANESETIKSKKYLPLLRTLMKDAIALAFDPNKYEDCSGNYIKKIMINAMLTDSISAEHLMLVYLLNDQPYWSNIYEFSYSEQLENSENINKPDRSFYEKYRINQRDNLAIFEAIETINAGEFNDYKFSADILQYFLPQLESFEVGREEIRKLTGAELLDNFAEICEKLGCIDCTLYRSAVKNKI